MYASSISDGEPATMPGKVMGLGSKSRPDIRIILKDEKDQSSVMTYSTLDRIEGTVTVTSPYDMQLANIAINFLGTSKTHVQKVSTSTAVAGRSEAFHQFLKLAQPLSRSDLPENGILKAGETHTFAFVFVVPQQLLPRVCRHETAGEQVRESHLCVPPSIGDKHISGTGDKLMDDLTPEMASIRYAVTVRLTEKDEAKAKSNIVARKVRIIPTVYEQPPVSIDGPDNDYTMRCEKDVKKGVLKGKMGRLVLEIAQPKSIRLPAVGSDEEAALSTMATIRLRFDPMDAKSPPPRLGSLNSKFKAVTFYSNSARTIHPTKKSIAWDLNQGLHSESISLPSRYMTGVEWTHHENGEAPLLRQHSGLSTSSRSSQPIPQPSEKYQGQGFYTAEILVPINLPTNKVFVPTFHTCLISRVYSISLHLGLHSVIGAPTLDLRVPVQVSAEPSIGAQRRVSLPVAADGMDAMSLNQFFEPRIVSPMPEHLMGRSSLPGIQEPEDGELPPDYDSLPSRNTLSVPVY